MSDISRLKTALRTGSLSKEARAAADRLPGAAAGARLLDVAWATIDSPVGPLVLAATLRGLVRLAFGEDPEPVAEELAGAISPRILRAPERLDGARRQLDEYFAGRRRRFDLALDWRLSTGFNRRVLRATARIPFGEVATYGQIARSAGNERASRAAGNALGGNPIAIVVPCHRVLRTGGDLGGYGGGLDKKEFLLHLEGAR
jgi:methylated-DNA-[protein]-cysteine S-methyltransferase